MHRRTRLFIATAAAIPAAALWALPASAHVDAAIDSQDGSTVTITWSFEHGCEEQPTTGLEIKLPDGTTNVEPQSPAGWTAALRDGTVLTWTGGSIPDGEAAAFTASMTLTAAEGDTVPLPTIQQCGDTSTEWIQTPGADGAEPEHPAPTVVMGTVGPSEHDDSGEEEDEGGEHDDTSETTEHDDSGESDAEAEAAETDAGELGAEATTLSAENASSEDDSSSNTAAIIGVIFAIVVLGGGGIYLIRKRDADKDAGTPTTTGS